MNLGEILETFAPRDDLAVLSAAAAVHAEVSERMDSLQPVKNNAFNEARTAAKAILNRLCEQEGIPIEARAAFSAAFHSKAWTVESPWVDFVRRAESYAGHLAAIDSQLKEPNAPIVGFRTGRLGEPHNDPRALRYAYRVSDGSGLTYNQFFHREDGDYFHTATAQEQQLPGRLNVRDNSDPNSLLISNMLPDELIAAVITPEKAAELLKSIPEKPTLALVIGRQAVQEMFQHAGDSPRADLLLGHAVRLGFQPDPQ